MARTVDVKVGPFTKEGVEAPDGWSDTAVGIAARMYMTAEETSIYQLIDRVVGAITDAGSELGYFANAHEQAVFRTQLAKAVEEQRFAFNTPVWMNVGIPGRNQQAWACLILDVDDSMDSIEAGWGVESATFRGGSGSGVNVSKIRAAGEPLSDGNGVGSGPISLWMRPTDAIAGVVRSGGRTRRAAKMVVMDVDHPEVFDFIRCKADAERMARDLQGLGYDITMTGVDSANIPFQQANNSVRVTDAFMEAVAAGEAHATTWRKTGETADVYEARELWSALAQATWECGDPGVQFHDNTNRWHTCPKDGEITASNPCSEYLWLGNTVCNLGSINLMSFEDEEKGFDIDRFCEVIDLAVTAMDILVDLTCYPTDLIAQTSRRYRTLGLGFTNLGALLMSRGLPYDSEEGRDLAASIMALLQGRAVSASAQVAERLGPYEAFSRNRKAHLAVLAKHSKFTVGMTGPIWSAAKEHWTEAIAYAEVHGQRNAQLSVIAPTGTISLMMDCETTGIEPVLAVDATKHLVGGGTLDVGVQKCVAAAVKKNSGSKVFQTALGENAVSPEGHVRMMAAVQPFVSGGISKTVNLPSSATPEEVERVYMLAWTLGLKAIAVFRDGCKAYQPVTAKGNTPARPETAAVGDSTGLQGRPLRRRPAGTRSGVTHKFAIEGVEYYVTVNEYPDGTPCELFIKSNKHGSATAGPWDVASIAVSLGLQYGVPLDKFVEHFQRMNFMPQGMVISDSDIKMADSPADYIFRWVGKRWIPTDLPITESNMNTVLPIVIDQPCGICGSSRWLPTGTCRTCAGCGQVSGGCS